MFTIRLVLVSLLVCVTQAQAQSNGKNIVFDLADLTVDYKTDHAWVTLEAFKSSLNSIIIEKKEVNNYGQLNWLSIGFPKLVQTYNQRENKSELFRFSREGFIITIDMLTNEHREMFRNVIKRKYDIDVHLEQIVSLIPSKYECQMFFYSGLEKILINGKVTQLNRFPSKVFFLAPTESKERIEFEKRLKEDGENVDLEISCTISSQGQTYRQNTLIIQGKQMNQLGLIDKIFGDGSEVYVTRDQLNTLSIEIYQKLNVIEDYQIPQLEFRENFISDFLKQTADLIYEKVDIDEALSSLSKYDFTQDIQPNVIKSELSRLFYIDSEYSKDVIHVNKTLYDNMVSSNSKSGGGGFSFLKFGASANFANSHSSDWKRNNVSVNNQLNELNNYAENEIEWSRNGRVIEPKSIKVSKLSKSKFEKDLIFSRIKREYFDASFKREFSLFTLDKLQPPALITENSRRLEALEKQVIRTKEKLNDDEESYNQINKSNSLIVNDIAQIKESLKSETNTLNNRISLVESNTQQQISSLDKTKVVKGQWLFNGKRVDGYPIDSVSADFGVHFKQPPTVFFTLKTYHIGNNRAGLFSVVNEVITSTSMSAQVKFYGVFDCVEMTIEWVAIGSV